MKQEERKRWWDSMVVDQILRDRERAEKEIRRPILTEHRIRYLNWVWYQGIVFSKQKRRAWCQAGVIIPLLKGGLNGQ